MKNLLIISFIFLISCSSPQSNHPESKISIDPNLVIPYTFELEKSAAYAAPYIAKYTAGEKRFVYIAANHLSLKDSPDPSLNPAFRTIEYAFTNYRPEVVILEGLNTGDTLSPQSVVGQAKECEAQNYRGGCSETDLAINLALKTKARYISGEPSPRTILDQLIEKGHTHEDLLAFYLVRKIPQLKRQNNFKREDFETLANDELYKYRRMLNIEKPFDYNSFKTWYAKYMKTPKNFLDIDHDDPAPHGGDDATYVQRISHDVSQIRDRGLLKRIEQMLNRYERVMVVYGASHYLTQAPALKPLGTAEYKKLSP